MKVALPKDNNGGTKKFNPPPLPLVDEELTEEDKTKTCRFKLRTTPAVDTSPTYDFNMRKLNGGEGLRHALRFARDMHKVFAGLHIQADEAKHRLYEEMMTGEALNQYKSGADKSNAADFEALRNAAYDAELANSNDVALAQDALDAVVVPDISTQNMTDGIKQVIIYMSPHKALSKQKRWLRRFCRKPAGMPIRTFSNHVTRINNEELPMLAPFHGNVQRLSDDEIIDIVLNGIPRSWLREMDKQGFDPVEHELTQVIEFCERMENAEDFESAREGGKTKSKDDKKSKSSNKKSSGGNKHCLLHGDNNTHTTDECLVLKKQAKQLRSGNDGDRKPAFKNKTWKRDADKSTNASKKELAAFVRKQARKELYAFAKKRKASDDGEEEDLNAMEEGEIDFSALNFADMGNLKIGSDDEDEKDSDEVSV